MDANVEFTLGEVNRVHYEGQHITALDTIAGQAKNAVVEGQTLVNLASKQIIDYTATSDWDGFKALGQNSATQESWRVLQDLKPNTKYFISCYVETFNVGENQGYLLNNSNHSTVFAESLEVKATGFHKWVLTSKSEFTKEVSIALRCQNKNARGAIKIRDIMMIEYQEGMEYWDIPFFEGLASVKAPVLHSVGKNLYNPDTAYVVGINNQDINNKVDVKANTQYTFYANGYGWTQVKLYNNTGQMTRQLGQSSASTKVSFTTTNDEVQA